MKRSASIAPAALWVLATALVAGTVHIASVFAMPRFAGRDAYARLASLTSDKGFSWIPAPRPGNSAIPFNDPGTLIAVCRYDLDAAPLRVRATAGAEDFSTLSFHARSGVVFHAVTERAALRGEIDILLGTAAQIAAIEAADSDEGPASEIRLQSPTRTGFVLLRAMPASAFGLGALRKRVEAAECAPGP